VIRGIGLNDFGEGHEAPVTAYVDEFYLVSVPATGFSMLDLGRVEILRGPQGTLFGRNSTGGLVHFVSARPTETPEGFVSLTAGRFEEYKLEGAVSGPLTDTLSGRLSVLSHHSEGYLRNANGLRPAGQAGTDAIRGQLQWMDDDLTVLFKGEYGEIETRHLYYQQVPAVIDADNANLFVRDPGGADGAGYNQAFFRGGRAASSEVADTDYPSKLQSDAATALLRIERDFGATTLTSISGYSDLTRDLSEDCDASPNDICTADFPYSVDSFSQELRWAQSTGGTRWVTGVYFLDASASNTPSATFNFPLDGPAGVDPTTGLYRGAMFPLALAADWRLDTRSYSLFGQVDHDVGAFTLTFGARVTRDEKDFIDHDNASLRMCNNFDLPNNCFSDYEARPYSGEYRETLYSGKLQLDWRPIDGVLIYGSLSRGTKAGGFNNGFYPSDIPFNQIPYGDETVHAIEIGAKNTLASGRVRLNAAAFHYDYGDFQTFNWIGIGGVIVNRDATSQGVELEIEAALSDSLTATIGLAGLDTNIEDVALRDGSTVLDREMAMAPSFSAHGSLAYERNLGARAMLSLLWDFDYLSDYESNNFNDPAASIDAHFIHSTRVGLTLNEQWAFGVMVSNISNTSKVNRVFVFDSLGYAQDMHTRPRTYSAQLTYRW
jgi:iron complex outermembrane receptor protein